MLFRRFRKTRASADVKGADSLAQGAQSIYGAAKKERWPLTHIAEQSGRPIYWFAESMLRVVSVFGRRPDEAEFVCLTRELISGHALVEDMSALVAPDPASPRFIDLRVSKLEQTRYSDWARTVQ